MIYFKSDSHKERFISAMQTNGKVYEANMGAGTAKFLDQEYAAAFYVLSADSHTWESAQAYISRSGIRIEELLSEVDFSSGFVVLIKWAGNLFNGNENINPVELMRLDEDNFKIAMTAVRLRRHPLPLASLEQAPLSDQALYLTLQTGRACIVVQEEYAAGNISNLDSYNRLYEATRTVDVFSLHIYNQIEEK